MKVTQGVDGTEGNAVPWAVGRMKKCRDNLADRSLQQQRLSRLSLARDLVHFSIDPYCKDSNPGKMSSGPLTAWKQSI